jgi:hypothetical protein
MFLWAASAWARTIEVPGEAANLAEAVGVAVEGDEIVLAAGTFDGLPDSIGVGLLIRGQGRNQTIVRRGATEALGAIQIDASVTMQDLSLDGRVRGTLLEVEDTTLTLQGVQVAAVLDLIGAAVELTGTGRLVATDTVFLGLEAVNGAISTLNQASVELTDCTFSGNQATSLVGGGGALHLAGTGQSVATDCVFLGNRAVGHGGAVLMLGTTSLEVVGGRFQDNQGDEGGGAIAVLGANLTVRDVTFVSNETRGNGYGGAIELEEAQAAFYRPMFCANLATGADAAGGAISSLGGSLDVFNGTFVLHESYDEGAVFVRDGAASIEHATFVANESSQGAAVHLEATASQHTITLLNSVVAENVAEEGEGAVQANDVRPIAVQAVGFWDNQDLDTVGSVEPIAPTLAPLPEAPFAPLGEECPDGVLVPISSHVLDQGLGIDLDGSVADLGATGGPNADPALWADCDNDDTPAWADPDDGDCPSATGTGTLPPPGWRPPPERVEMPPDVGCGCATPPGRSGLPALLGLFGWLGLLSVVRCCTTSHGRVVRLR